ncbi:hypothetical protein EC988_002768 [Linderina pennispora]|nr:hypothetical protein EC988_002768 [Linderina pennispora]
MSALASLRAVRSMAARAVLPHNSIRLGSVRPSVLAFIHTAMPTPAATGLQSTCGRTQRPWLFRRSKSTDTKPPSTTASAPTAASDPNEARMLIGFTCKVCKHRQYKTMAKQAYEKGVVLIQCDSCKNRHLIADNLGWFRDKSVNIEQIMKDKGESVRQMADAGLLDNIEAEQVEKALNEYEQVKESRSKKPEGQ